MSRASVSPARARSTASAILAVTESAIDLASSPCRPAADPKWCRRLAWVRPILEATAIYNALSSTFPIGEAYFVESVRAFREGAPPKLAEEIKAFTTQEAIHSREHDAFNKRAEQAGYDLSKLEKRVEERLSITRS